MNRFETINEFRRPDRSASSETVLGLAGRIFERQVESDNQTNYKEKKAFDDAIYYIAQEAKDYGFQCFGYMPVEEIASIIGSHISHYLWLEQEGGYPGYH
ncbi:MAG TPA: hypothetical protein VKR06_44675 [Ktedonosporobacter sp.]|nr:hypothetical protein [Ktedonosporobacter sp.]